MWVNDYKESIRMLKSRNNSRNLFYQRSTTSILYAREKVCQVGVSAKQKHPVWGVFVTRLFIQPSSEDDQMLLGDPLQDLRVLCDQGVFPAS